jgi:hypothetical protein
MRKPRITHAPDVIYIQVGDIDEDVDFRQVETEDVTWCEDRQFDSDLEYRLVKRRKRATVRESEA